MADFYAQEFIGGPDGSAPPPKKLDGRLVGAKERSVRASKGNIALAAGDRLYIGKLPAGSTVKAITIIASIALNAANFSIGTTGTPGKYVSNKPGSAAADVPFLLGPSAASALAAPLAADEELWLTLLAGGLVNAALLGVDLTYKIST